MEQIEVLPSIVAKALILVDVLADSWVSVSSYAVNQDGVNVVAVTPLECGLEMYSDAEWIITAAFHWFMPKLIDLMYGLTLTYV